MTAVTWESIPVPAGSQRRPGPSRSAHLHLVPAVNRARPAMRLTRLGRLVVSVGALVLLACAALSVAAASAGTSGPAAPSRSVTVRAGQTLSEIAVTQLPQLPMDVAVTRIQLANGLSTSQVLAGQVLLVPGS